MALALVTHELLNSFSTHTIVVQIHQGSRIAHLTFTSIDELAGKIASISYIC
jgi:hypothetical protein